jgi:hypothetical protein
MGLMRFHIQPPERITDEMVQQAYLSGIDRVAWPVRTTFENGMLLMHRSVSESANLHFPWPLEGGGQMIFSTASLMEQETPYLLPLELARGTVSQLADQLFDWKSIGLIVPDALCELVSESIRQMAAAAMAQDNPAASAHRRPGSQSVGGGICRTGIGHSAAHRGQACKFFGGRSGHGQAR